MAGLTYSIAEFNTIITMLGCLCATVQAATGAYAGYKKKKLSLLKTNDILFRAHRAFGGFATTLYFLGLFAGITGFLGAIFFDVSKFEILDFSFNFHVWPSFAIAVIVIYKTYLSYFRKRLIYKHYNWLGVATFIAWSYNWVSSAFSYYLRTIPFVVAVDAQHPPPTYLLPIELLWLQIILPFLIGAILGYIIIRKADQREK
ncbi:MAG: hypothetical protein KGD61_07305 [Candidatus Lokiarchaeota archaeon]|nr:hypothetical protein [Candidatus Lokiarchaeota archaeon]